MSQVRHPGRRLEVVTPPKQSCQFRESHAPLMWPEGC